MNFEDFESIWSRQLIVGQPVSAELVRHALVQEVRQRSRRVWRIMGVAAFVFVVGWATALVMHYTRIKPFTAQDLSYLGILTCFDLVFFSLAVATLRQNRDEQARMGSSVTEALHGSRRAIERQMRDCRRLAFGAALALFLNVAFMSWKFYGGSFPLRGMIAGLGLDLAFAIGLAVTLHRYYRRHLQPRRAQLQQQLEELGR
jgi:hypothetical protein